MRPPLYVPENRLAHQQLRLMQRRGINMAVVVDEHGGTVGIVTVEDLLEEIVGEIEDEYDEREVLYETLDDGARARRGRHGDRPPERDLPVAAAGRATTRPSPVCVITQLGRVPRPRRAPAAAARRRSR